MVLKRCVFLQVKTDMRGRDLICLQNTAECSFIHLNIALKKCIRQS